MFTLRYKNALKNNSRVVFFYSTFKWNVVWAWMRVSWRVNLFQSRADPCKANWKEKSQSMNGNCFVLTPVWLVQLIITCVIFIHRNIFLDKEQLCRQQQHNSAIFMVSSSILCWIMNWGCSFQNKHLIHTCMSMEKICHNYGII